MKSLQDVQVVSGWGNYPRNACRSTWAENWSDVKRSASEPLTSLIARGLGRSYGDSSLNANGIVLNLRRLNHFLDFDPDTGQLECEAGVSFAEIIEYFLPRGWFLPTTPGTKFVTVGGAIAADVHGKNHHVDGSFGNFVVRMKLLLADGRCVECSREDDPDLFWATIGGMGLTGVILSAVIRLSKVATAYCDVRYRRTENLGDTLDAFETTHRDYQYSVAWIDCVATGPSMGKSVVMLGNTARKDQLSPSLRNRPLRLPVRAKRQIPFYFPSGVLNPWTVKAFNTLYYANNRDSQRIVDFNSFFYPLDGVEHWNRIYGRAGFVQYQALFPSHTARAGLQRLLKCISDSRQASFLAVLKGSGDATPGMLSYLFPGYTLALDFPYRGAETKRLFATLDQIVLEHEGRLYLAKDSMTSSATFAKMYPRLPEFLAVKSRVDPENRFASSQARRLGIVQESSCSRLVQS